MYCREQDRIGLEGVIFGFGLDEEGSNTKPASMDRAGEIEATS